MKLSVNDVLVRHGRSAAIIMMFFAAMLALGGIYRSRQSREAVACPVDLASLLESKATLLPIPSPAPAWQLVDLKGNTLKLSDYKGKVVVLNFWSSWCGPCCMEIPDLNDLQKMYADRGLVIIGVAVFERDSNAVPQVVRDEKIDYSVAWGDEAIVAAYGNFDMVPTSFIVDRDGTLTYQHRGYVPREILEKEITPLLKP